MAKYIESCFEIHVCYIFCEKSDLAELQLLMRTDARSAFFRNFIAVYWATGDGCNASARKGDDVILTFGACFRKKSQSFLVG